MFTLLTSLMRTPTSLLRTLDSQIYYTLVLYLQRHPELLTIKPGTKLVVYGKPFKQKSMKHSDREEPALTVHYLEYIAV